MAFPQKPKKNTLSIHLAESAVFLRTDYSNNSRRNSSPSSFSRDGMLRGLVVLDLVKPTKITRIDVELTATTSTACPEGVGARRIDVNEVHRVFHTSTTFFRASAPEKHCCQHSGLVDNPAQHRRSVSIGPGVSYTQTPQNDPNVEEEEESEGDIWERWSRTSTVSPRRFASSRGSSPPLRIRGNRRMSVDGSRVQSLSTLRSLSIPPIPPYSPYPPSNEQSSYHSPTNSNLSSSILRRRTSFTIPEDEPEDPSSSTTMTTSLPGTIALPITVSPPITVSNHTPNPLEQHQNVDQRGRLPLRGLNAHKRFSLAAVSSRFLDAVHSSSPVRFLHGHDNERELSPREGSVGSISVSPSVRGRRRQRNVEETVRGSTVGAGEDAEDGREWDGQNKRRTSILARILGQEESEEFPPGMLAFSKIEALGNFFLPVTKERTITLSPSQFLSTLHLPFKPTMAQSVGG